MSLRHLSLALVAVFSAVAPWATAAETDRLLIFGASGRIGSHIVDEALLRGYEVTGVARDAGHLDDYDDRIEVAIADILDRERTAELIAGHDAVIVSIEHDRVDNPENYIASLAAESLIEVLEKLGDDGPRLIFVGSQGTLIYEDGKTLLELERVEEAHEYWPVYYSHQIALDGFRASQYVNWTVATPHGLRLEGRTGNLRWGGDVTLRDEDGKPSGISPEDFAYAIIEELESGNYVRQRFCVARQP